MRFTKLHGAGNDYIYLDCIRQAPPRDPAGLSRAVSDRHFGVGSDGLILICPSERADVRMRMFNADGSEAEMCGNGVRCVAKYVHDHGIAVKPRLAIETGRCVAAAGGRHVEMPVVGTVQHAEMDPNVFGKADVMISHYNVGRPAVVDSSRGVEHAERTEGKRKSMRAASGEPDLPNLHDLILTRVPGRTSPRKCSTVKRTTP